MSDTTTQLFLLPNAQQRFTDANGLPLAGGQVTLYLPNTSTYATAYSDPAGENPLPNPLTLDSEGFPEPTGQIWGTGAYREVVQDLIGNTIFDNETFVLIVSDAILPVLAANSTEAAAAALGLGTGIIVPCTAVVDASAITLTRAENTNPVSENLGIWVSWVMPSTASGPFTLAIPGDSVGSAHLYDETGNDLQTLQEDQYCVATWNPNFAYLGAWALFASNQLDQNQWPFSTNGTWVAPQGVGLVLCSGTAGGGAGGDSENLHSGGGGGGGGEAVQDQEVTVSPGGTYQINVGTGGATVAGAAGQAGNPTQFISSSFETLVNLAPGQGGGFGSTTGAGASVPGGTAGGAGVY